MDRYESKQFLNGRPADFRFTVKDTEAHADLSDWGYPVSGDRIALNRAL